MIYITHPAKQNCGTSLTNHSKAERGLSPQLAAQGTLHRVCSWISRSSETRTGHLHRQHLLNLLGLRLS